MCNISRKYEVLQSSPASYPQVQSKLRSKFKQPFTKNAVIKRWHTLKRKDTPRMKMWLRSTILRCPCLPVRTSPAGPTKAGRTTQASCHGI